MTERGTARNKAFEAAFESHADELFRHALFRLSDREKAVDLVQETYLRAYKYAKEEDIHDMRAFLYRTLRHLVIDEYRRKKSYSLDAMVNTEGEGAETLMPADLSNTIEAATERLDAKAALEAVPKLAPAYAEALLLRFVDGLTPGEMGKRLGISENLASVRIHRALRALRDLLEREPQP